VSRFPLFPTYTAATGDCATPSIVPRDSVNRAARRKVRCDGRCDASEGVVTRGNCLGRTATAGDCASPSTVPQEPMLSCQVVVQSPTCTATTGDCATPSIAPQEPMLFVVFGRRNRLKGVGPLIHPVLQRLEIVPPPPPCLQKPMLSSCGAEVHPVLQRLEIVPPPPSCLKRPLFCKIGRVVPPMRVVRK
jgi:hypothetical protein